MCLHRTNTGDSITLISCVNLTVSICSTENAVRDAQDFRPTLKSKRKCGEKKREKKFGSPLLFEVRSLAKLGLRAAVSPPPQSLAASRQTP